VLDPPGAHVLPVQLVHVVAALAPDVLAGQVVQEALELAATAVEKVPAAQAEHTVSAAPVPYDPAAQPAHTVRPVPVP